MKKYFGSKIMLVKTFKLIFYEETKKKRGKYKNCFPQFYTIVHIHLTFVNVIWRYKIQNNVYCILVITIYIVLYFVSPDYYGAFHTNSFIKTAFHTKIDFSQIEVHTNYEI